MFSRGPKYFDCVDLHCGGEPARVVFGTDLPTLDGVSMAEKRDNFMRCQQHVADLLLKVLKVFHFKMSIYTILKAMKAKMSFRSQEGSPA